MSSFAKQREVETRDRQRLCDLEYLETMQSLFLGFARGAFGVRVQDSLGRCHPKGLELNEKCAGSERLIFSASFGQKSIL